VTPAEKPRSVHADLPQDLDVVGRLVLTTDGTVTPMLEQIVGESIVTAGIDQHYTEGDQPTRDLLRVPAGEKLLSRSLDLVGARSAAVYAQARSVALPRALPVALLHGLLGTREPIGAMLRSQRTETFREILGYEAGGEPQNRWVSRKYRIFIGGVPTLLICERFTTACLNRSPI
jgi:chorismate-pyruvate lyase